MTPYYQDESTTIYHGDCREILPTLGRFDLLLTDPPYGIQADQYRKTLPNKPGSAFVSAIANDDSLEVVEWLFKWLDDETSAVVFGASNFPHLLPHCGRWLCWDKRTSEKLDKMLGSPIELAWENRRSGFHRMVRVMHGGVINADSEIGNNARRQHPTQKPATLFRKILGHYHNAETIIDPFLGSGTTLVAAKLEGRKAVGIELEERYCEIAANRLCQGVLF